jgi:hypothetical protein
VESQKKTPKSLKVESDSKWYVSFPGEDDGSPRCCGIQDSLRILL